MEYILLFIAVALSVTVVCTFFVWRSNEARLRPLELGPATTVKRVFSAGPGAHCWADAYWGRRGYLGINEHFIVAIRCAKDFDFKVDCRAPFGMSKHRLDAYSDAMFLRLFKGYFPVKSRRAPQLNRTSKTSLALALSALPDASSGLLEVRDGLMVLRWSRHLAYSAFRFPDPAVLQRQRSDAMAAACSSLSRVLLSR